MLVLDNQNNNGGLLDLMYAHSVFLQSDIGNYWLGMQNTVLLKSLVFYQDDI